MRQHALTQTSPVRADPVEVDNGISGPSSLPVEFDCG
jgi:hypothetical protein